MTTKRLFLYAILLGCLGLLMYGVFAPRQKEKDSDPSDRPASPAQPELHNFRMPSVSSSGVTQWIASGARAIHVKGNMFKVYDFALEMFTGVNADTGDQQVLRVASKTADINRRTKAAMLHEDVVVRFDKNTALYTSKMRYNPDSNTLETDEPVRLVSKDILVSGTGLLVDVTRNEATVPRDVRVSLKNVRASFLHRGGRNQAGAKTTTAAPTPPEVRISCAGRLVVQRINHSATFYDDVEVTQGNTRLTADQLLIFVDSKTRKPSRLIAAHDVVITDGKNTARGAKLNWDAANELVILDGDPMVVVETKGMLLRCSRALYLLPDEEFSTATGGYLVTKGRMGQDEKKPKGKKAKQAPPRPVEIVWRGLLTFKRSEGKAVFSDDVKVVRGDGILRCSKLELTLGGKEPALTDVRAQGHVSIVQGERSAQGEEFIYYVKSARGQLTGKPFAVAKQKGAVLRSRIIHFFDKDQRTKGEGPGDLTLPPKKGAKGPDAQPIRVRWVGGMELSTKDKRAVFRKGVVAERGDSVIKGEVLEAYFNDDNDVTRIVARNDVEIDTPGRVGKGNSFEWQLADGRIVLIGEPMAELQQQGRRIWSKRFVMHEAKMQLNGFGPGRASVPGKSAKDGTTPEPTNVTWQDSMAFDGQAHTIDFRGNVVATRGTSELQAGLLTMLLTGKNDIKAIQASQGVHLQDGQREGLGETLYWDYTTDIAELLPKPGELVKVKEPGVLMTGVKAVYHCKDQRFRLISREQPEKPRIILKPAQKTSAPAKQEDKTADGAKKPPGRPVLRFLIDRSKD